MHKKVIVKFVSVMLCLAMGISAMSVLSGCGKKKDSIVIMTEALSGLFNPFYATSGSDMDVVGMTQISMLSTDKTGKTVANDTLPTVVKDFKVEEAPDKSETVYTFVLKNGIKFSDGKPLTMNDVLFNIYEYLDPVYTGSSTMYSIKIKGLRDYRLQTRGGGSSTIEQEINENALGYATERINMLVTLYEDKSYENTGSYSSYSVTEAQMKAAINALTANDFSEDYKNAVAYKTQQSTFDYTSQLLEDYNLTLKTFREELESDYTAAQESYDTTTLPYSEHAKLLESDLFRFLLYEDYIKPVYAKIPGTSRDDKAKIERFDNENLYKSYKNKDEAIDRVFNDKITNELNSVLTGWGTAGTLKTIYAAAATDVLLHNNAAQHGGGDGLLVKYIEGVRSLGHHRSDDTVPEKDSVTIGSNTYTVAKNHNADGTPANNNEYDVLEITIEGVDPKAIFNFGFTVAPEHYYSGKTVNIAANEFGVDYASSSFQRNVIQSQRNVSIPVGAGAFKATNSSNDDDPGETEFWRNSTVYFKKNENFLFEVKAEKLRMLEVSSTNAIDKLDNGEVDYISPQYTMTNARILKNMKDTGKFDYLTTTQLGYGYIGINAGKVPNPYIRMAIMSAMETSQAIQFYEVDTCKTIDWPMSMVSWAYPFEADGKTSKPSGHDYTQWTGVDAAKAKITKYVNMARDYNPSTCDTKITFTIAGASITDHPTYEVFKQAREILNEMGWNVEVKADSQALTKLSTGALEVWAAAWGSTIDPDMYQVYHKDSTASSVYAWGYREIKENQTRYSYEFAKITELSKLIDEARQITVPGNEAEERSRRAAKYEDAMELVLDLAVEMPVYQRDVAYAYNTRTLKGLVTDINPYSSPLERIWELELV